MQKRRFAAAQGCQIFLGTTYQNGEKIYQITIKYIIWPEDIPNSHNIYIPNSHKIYPMKKINPIFSITRPSKIYPNRDFWSENKPSGSPAAAVRFAKCMTTKGSN
jgi:hypothetical protein